MESILDTLNRAASTSQHVDFCLILKSKKDIDLIKHINERYPSYKNRYSCLFIEQNTYNIIYSNFDAESYKKCHINNFSDVNNLIHLKCRYLL